MVKPRKQKSEEQKAESTEAVVRHQKLCLSIDMDKKLVYGYTELQMEVPDNGIVALHADNLFIEAITVDGEPARSEIFPHYVPLDSENRWCGVSSAASAADAAGSVYLSTLERELVPNLLIMCPKSDVSASGQQENSENGLNSSEETKQNVRLVRVDYWVEKAETGIHFEGDVLHTDNQIRRARCWFPCMDDSSQCCCYDLEFTVAENFVAVSTGNLLYQVLSKDGLHKTYAYRVNVPVASQWISLVVAPFEIISDSHTHLLSYICLQGSMEKLKNTVGFFHSAFSYYEEYLSTSFPFGSYTQVFLSPEMAISSMSLGASMAIFSSQYLFDEKVIDQTIDTRIKFAFALARQWFGIYVSAEDPIDDWLLDGLAWFLTDLFIKQFLGNNEARFRRFKANSAVCKADDSGATALSSPTSTVNLYGTQCIGFYGKMRSWKSVAVLQMLEKQMGPESFRKILQIIVSRAQDPLRTLSTTEFRHLANKVGNLERPFLKEFFPRWVGSCGCPVLRMGFSYNKRKNLIELAGVRGCTATSDSIMAVMNGNPDIENREGNVGWPGMMSIRVHELDGMYDHPILPMAGEAWQLLEMQCHSKFAAKRFQKSKKGSKPDGSDENGDVVSAIDVRSNSDSPLLWLRADPEMEYLAEINFNQPVQMWINQLERDKDVVAQAQAIAMLQALPHLSFSVVNALSNFLGDEKAFWRVRIEAAFALATTATEETDWAGLLHLIKFYKSQRFDANIGLPKPNDFHDLPEYFVLEAIPNAVAMVRASDEKSPREAVELLLQLLKYNDNNGNPYSDVFWLAALVQSIGGLEFGQQSIPFLSSLLKHIDRLLQFDRLMPSHNGILTISCIRTLTQLALKLSKFIPLDRVVELIKPFRGLKIMWQVRIEACKALLDLEFHCKGFDGALTLFMRYMEEEPTLRGQVKIGLHVTRLCQMRSGSHSIDGIKSDTLKSLLCLLESHLAFNNVILRHYLFCVLQVLAGRPPTLHGVPRNETTQMGHAEMINFFAALMNQPKHFELPVHDPNSSDMVFTVDIPCTSMVDHTADLSTNLMQQEPVAAIEILEPEPTRNVPDLVHADPTSENLNPTRPEPPLMISSEPNENIINPEAFVIPEAPKEVDTVSNSHEQNTISNSHERNVISNSHERRRVLKIKVRQSAASSRAEDADNLTVERSRGAQNDAGPVASSSVSVDAPQKMFAEAVSISNQNLEEVNSCQDPGSRMTASIGSAKLASEGEELGKELQCTADSSNILKDNGGVKTQKYVSLQTLSVSRRDPGEEKGKKRGKEKKRKRDKDKNRRDDPEYREKKRLKKEKKQKEKEIAKLLSSEVESAKVKSETHFSKGSEEVKKDEIGTRLKLVSKDTKQVAVESTQVREEEQDIKRGSMEFKPGESGGPKVVLKMASSRADQSEASSSHKFRIKIKKRTPI